MPFVVAAGVEPVVLETGAEQPVVFDNVALFWQSVHPATS
jgi:hypothetical protein